MPWHTVAQGEWIAQIAARYGFADPAPILNHGDNADLLKKRPQQQILLPNDQLFIPDPSPKSVTCATNKSYRFRIKLPPKAKLNVFVHDEDGEAIKSKPFVLTAGGVEYKGTSGGDGKISIDLPLTTVSDAQLEIDGHTLPLNVGHVDPIDEISGVKGRLNNLRFECGEANDVIDDAYTAAVRAFQTRYELTVSGTADDATKSKLKQVFGC
jgi:hypothetical protein